MRTGQKATYEGQEGTITAIAKGWVTLALTDGAEVKARAKELTVKALDKIQMVCTECEHGWELDPNVEKAVNVRCPACKAWNRVRLHPNMENYVRGLGTTSSGAPTLDINDDVAEMLRGLDVDDLYVEASEILEGFGIESMSKSFRKVYGDIGWTSEQIEDHLRARYAKRNNGMIRMNIGNIVRSAQKRRLAIEAA